MVLSFEHRDWTLSLGPQSLSFLPCVLCIQDASSWLSLMAACKCCQFSTFSPSPLTLTADSHLLRGVELPTSASLCQHPSLREDCPGSLSTRQGLLSGAPLAVHGDDWHSVSFLFGLRSYLYHSALLSLPPFRPLVFHVLMVLSNSGGWDAVGISSWEVTQWVHMTVFPAMANDIVVNHLAWLRMAPSLGPSLSLSSSPLHGWDWLQNHHLSRIQVW